MLSQDTVAIVKSTAPILQEHGEVLTRHFYQRMFTHNPEVAPFFNAANQAGGTQQRALAGAICAYAANIDNLPALAGAVELIAQKHTSLQIKPEHYPIVGENLLASISEVLGAGATDAVINAWGEAYGFLADILIGREGEIYGQNAQQPGGWDGFRAFTVERKEAENDIITSFYLKPADGGALPTFSPGQYITVRVPTPDGDTTMRNYSLSSKSGLDYFRISVKRESGTQSGAPEGYVSNLLHKEIAVGSTLEIGAPCGEFLLRADAQQNRPLVLLAAGIGVTPILSMLKTAVGTLPERQIVFVHACVNEQAQAFRSTVETLAAAHPNLLVHYRYDELADAEAIASGNASVGFVDAALLESLVPGHDADYYFCGPKPFMANIYRQLRAWDIPDAQVNFEFFGPRQELETAA